MAETAGINVFLGQIGLGKLTEAEKQDFIDFINEDLARDGAGKVEPITSDQIHKNGMWENLEHAAAVIELIKFTSSGLHTKKLHYFVDMAEKWLTQQGKDLSEMPFVKKINNFVAGDDGKTGKEE